MYYLIYFTCYQSSSGHSWFVISNPQREMCGYLKKDRENCRDCFQCVEWSDCCFSWDLLKENEPLLASYCGKIMVNLRERGCWLCWAETFDSSAPAVIMVNGNVTFWGADTSFQVFMLDGRHSYEA